MLQPIADRVLVKLDPKVEKVGSLFIPDTKESENMSGIIVAKGKGKNADLVEVGQHVLIAKMFKVSKESAQLRTSAFTTGLDADELGKDHLMLEADQIIAVIED